MRSVLLAGAAVLAVGLCASAQEASASCRPEGRVLSFQSTPQAAAGVGRVAFAAPRRELQGECARRRRTTRRRARPRRRRGRGNIFRRVGGFFRRVGSGIKRGFRKMGDGLKKGFNKFGKGLKKVGKAIGKGLKKVGKAVLDVVAGPIKLIIKIAKGLGTFIKLVGKHGFGGALKELWKRFKAKLKREGDYMKSQFKTMFEGFRSVLTMKKFSLGSIEKFARTVVKSVKNLITRFNTNIGIPKLFATVLGWIAAAPLYPAVIGATTPLAAISFGFRALMKFIIPKLILGTGKAFDAAKHSKAGKIFGKIVQGLLKVVGMGGGLIFKFIKNPKMKERIRGLFVRIADVSGKIQKGIQGAMKVAEAVRSGNFSSVENALKSTAPLPTKLSKDDLGKIVNGLMDFGREQVWLLLSPKLRTLLTKALSAMDRLIDIPRNALVGAVGTIPFAGGVLAAALNFGLGIIVDMIKNFFIDNVMKMAETLLGDVWKDIQGSVSKQLLASSGSRKATGKFIEMVQAVGKLAGDVSTAMKSASQGVQGTISSLVSTALDKFILRGVRNPNVRKILADAVGTVVEQFTKQKKFSLSGAVVEVLKKIGSPLSALVAQPIKNANLKSIVQKGMQTILGSLASDSGVKKIMSNPLGFLTEIGKQLLGKVKGDLANMILGRISNPKLRDVVAAAIGALTDTIERGGFSALLPFTKVLGKLYSALKQPLLALLLDKVKNPQLRAILENGLTFVADELESKGIGGALSGGLGQFFVSLFERIKDPLLDLLLKNVSSPIIRDGARKAIDAIVSKAKAGKLGELLNFKKVLADVIRFLKPHITEFIGGKISDPSFKSAMTAAVGPAVEKVAGMFEAGSFKGLMDVLVAVAEPALGALKAKVTGALPAPFNSMVGKAFDKVIPMLRTADGRSQLLREGPKMLWSAVVGYLKSLYEKAKSFVASKVNMVREAIFKVIEGVRGTVGNIGEVLKNLGNLGNLLKGVSLPSPT